MDDGSGKLCVCVNGKNAGKIATTASIKTSMMSSKVPIPSVSCPKVVLITPNSLRIGSKTASPTVPKDRAVTRATR